MNTQVAKDRVIFGRSILGVILTALIPMGCQELGLPSSLPLGGQIEPRYRLKTIFTPTPQDTAYLATLGKEAEKQLTTCQAIEDCDGAHFLRGLALIQENRDLALQHFQKVAVSPVDSPLTQSSRVWIWILDETNPANASSPTTTNLAQGLIRALLTQDLALARQRLFHPTPEQPSLASQVRPGFDAKIKTLTEQVQVLAHDVASLHNQGSAIQRLQKELDARDKKVEELTLQLDALRRIDQELKEKSTPTRLSETIIPKKDDRATTP